MQLTAKNSLTGLVEPLPDSELLRVYICGPTVYNSSHLGHARTYITFDIVRRILRDVFGRPLFYQMNITDIDDKIITRSREQQLDCSALAQTYEKAFFADMDALNVLRPDALTRVTECLPAIERFVARIVENGFGYQSNGSVYFDTAAFVKAGFVYPQLRYITTESQQELLQAGEGVSMKNRVDEKRHANDFALWKAAKEGEPAWQSVFGPGRPGWHIECSVMSNSVLIEQLGGFDLHFGGQDLQFPHHANEIAQLEAYYNKSGLVKMFMHSGHLKIDNEVMSKSKMNFKTIADVLKCYTSNQLRILFLQCDFAADINYSVNQLDYAVALDQKIVQFMQNVSALSVGEPPCLQAADLALLKQIQQTRLLMRQAYARNFDYSGAFKLLMQLLDDAKQYMQTCQAYVVRQVRDFVQQQLELLGFTFQQQQTDQQQFVQLLNQFRTALKQSDFSKGAVLGLCDQLRDEWLPPLGYSIEDKPTGPVVKQINYEEFMLNKRREQLVLEEKALKVQEMKDEKARKLKEQEMEAQVLAKDMFRTEEFAEWNEQGLPTKMADGSEVPKTKAKKLQKEWEARVKLNEKYGVK